MNLEELSGVLTITISVIGAAISFKHAFFYTKNGKDLSKKMRNVFITDGLIYLITLAFGMWAFLNLSQEIAYTMHWIRHPILLANILASYRLWSHYQRII